MTVQPMTGDTNVEAQTYDPELVDSPLEYRALSTGAVASLVLGLASVFLLPAALTSLQGVTMLSPIPLVGLVVGVRAVLKIRQMPDALTGATLAKLGVLFSALFLVGGFGLGSWVYATEVPDGAQRVTFVQMKPSETEKAKNVIVPPEVSALKGKRVFMKGYMRPSSQRFGLDTFLLVRDNNECCFGENLPEYYDRVQVHLNSPLRVDYSTRMFRVAGTLQIDPSAAGGDPGRPVFSLVADYVK